jgi:hypothetical protein
MQSRTGAVERCPMVLAAILGIQVGLFVLASVGLLGSR